MELVHDMHSQTDRQTDRHRVPGGSRQSAKEGNNFTCFPVGAYLTFIFRWRMARVQNQTGWGGMARFDLWICHYIQADRQDRQTDKETDSETAKDADRDTESQTDKDKETERQSERETKKQRDKVVEIQRDRHT